MMTRQQLLPEGTRIYYGGDMANMEGFGTIVKVEISRKWGSFYHIKLDDGRTIKHLSTCAFSEEYKGHGGTRFVTLKAYNDFRRKQWNESVFMQKCGEYREVR